MKRKIKFLKILMVIMPMILLVSIVTSNNIIVSTKIFSKSTVDGDTLYVGGSGPGNYSRIQDAIDDASDGDTIYVFSGIYNEYIVIETSINLIGEDKNTTIIDCHWGAPESWGGFGNVIFITASDVVVSGFTIISHIVGPSYPYHYSACIYVNADHAILTDNILINHIPNCIGIYLADSSHNEVIGNVFKKSEFGLVLSYSESNTIRDNRFISSGISFYHPRVGIQETITHWNSHIIEGNFVNDRPIYYYKNTEGFFIPSDVGQVILANCSYFTIENIDHSSHYFYSYNFGFFGIQLGYSSYGSISNNENIGILFYRSSHNSIYSNVINDQTNHFYGFLLVESNYNNIYGNVIENNICSGIEILTSSHNNVYNNCIKENGYYGALSGGILLVDSETTIINGNDIILNNDAGIFCSSVLRNNITNNNISGNLYGIRLKYNSYENSIYHNNFMENLQHAYDEGLNSWDDVFDEEEEADPDHDYSNEGNYWDDYNGEDSDEDGIGDTSYHIQGGYNYDTRPITSPYPLPELNHPPYKPKNPSPSNGMDDVSVDTFLQWAGGDPNPDDIVTYDVYFGTSTSPPIVISNQSETTYDPGTLDYETTYYWKIVSWDNHGTSKSGQIWEFATEQENKPPYHPGNPDPQYLAVDVDINTDLSWTGGDPNPDDIVTYDVYFGNVNPPAQVVWNQSDSVYDPETLEYETIYYWKIVSWDNHDAFQEGPIWEFTTQIDDDQSPTLEIIKPENGLYFRDKKILPLLKPLIIGTIDVEVEASDEKSGIEKVEFYIDDELKITDTSEPYIWTWDEKTPFRFRHTLTVIAYDTAGNNNREEFNVRKFL